MSFLGSVARTLGSAGNDYASAKFSLDDLNRQIAQAKLKDLMDQLQIQEGQQSLKEGQQRLETGALTQQEIQQRLAAGQQAQQDKTPAGIRAFLKGALGRDPTDEEMRIYLQIAPKSTAATTLGFTPDPTSTTGWTLLKRNSDGTVARYPNIANPAYAPTIKQGQQFWTDSEGFTHVEPVTTVTQKVLPKTGGTSSPSAPSKPSAPKPDRILGQKDTPTTERNRALAQTVYQQYQFAQSIASKPLTPLSSMSLAGIADKVLGGGHVASLKAQGVGKPILGVGGGYTPVAYTQEEADAIVSEILAKYQSLLMTAPPDASNSSSDVPPGVAPGDFEQVPVK